MRRFDIAIGLAVAWARVRGLSCATSRRRYHRRAGVAWRDPEIQIVRLDRGPLVRLLPYTDARVAVGIATAQSIWCVPWRR